jgi:hypothetical protein
MVYKKFSQPQEWYWIDCEELESDATLASTEIITSRMRSGHSHAPGQWQTLLCISLTLVQLISRTPFAAATPGSSAGFSFECRGAEVIWATEEWKNDTDSCGVPCLLIDCSDPILCESVTSCAREKSWISSRNASLQELLTHQPSSAAPRINLVTDFMDSMPLQMRVPLHMSAAEVAPALRLLVNCQILGQMQSHAAVAIVQRAALKCIVTYIVTGALVRYA